MKSTHNTQRREFLTTSAKAGFCFACGGVMSALLSACDTVEEGEPVVHLADYPELQTPGGAIKKRFRQLNNSEPILIIRLSEKEFAAYSALCTHKGVEVRLPKDGIIVCPNHGSRFRSNDGTVIDGKAIEPLKKFETSWNTATNVLHLRS
ncbi:MAG: Rieske (2Fe-2S) protein [Bacteroidota bacterium]